MDFLMRKVTGIARHITSGVPSDSYIESITDTGTTSTSSSVGPDAPVYKLGLQVTPVGGGAPYPVEVKAAIARLDIPMVLTGARLVVGWARGAAVQTRPAGQAGGRRSTLPGRGQGCDPTAVHPDGPARCAHRRHGRPAQPDERLARLQSHQPGLGRRRRGRGQIGRA